MPKLPSISGRDALRAFRRAGFMENRVNGSHHILSKEGHDLILSVPVHGSQPLRKGLLKGLIADSGLSLEEFLHYLHLR